MSIDLPQEPEEFMNSYKIIHIYNKNEKYHLTRQVLADSMLTQNTFCFFYHILTLDENEFNTTYGSFAFLIGRNAFEADMYLNVDSNSLFHIIHYVQTNKINCQEISMRSPFAIQELDDLASMLGMPNLVIILRNSSDKPVEATK